MEIIPAIDLRKGKVVRLFQGKPDEQTVYSDSPQLVAQEFERLGANHLHIIDLDRAFGEGNNAHVIKQICRSTSLDIQVGGGLRSIEDITDLLEHGAERS